MTNKFKLIQDVTFIGGWTWTKRKQWIILLRWTPCNVASGFSQYLWHMLCCFGLQRHKRGVVSVHNVKVHMDVQLQLHSIPSAVLGGGEWSISCTSHFTPVHTEHEACGLHSLSGHWRSEKPPASNEAFSHFNNMQQSEYKPWHTLYTVISFVLNIRWCQNVMCRPDN